MMERSIAYLTLCLILTTRSFSWAFSISRRCAGPTTSFYRVNNHRIENSLMKVRESRVDDDVASMGTNSTDMMTTSPSLTKEAATATTRPKPLPLAAGFQFLRESFQGQTHHYLLRLMQEHGENFIIWNKYVILNDPKAIQDVVIKYNLEKTPEVIRGYKSIFYRNGGILAAPWTEWLAQRRMTTRGLVEKELSPKIQIGSQPLFDLLDHASSTGEVVEMDSAFVATTTDIIGLVLLGKSIGMGDKLLEDGNNKEPVPFFEALNVLTVESIRQMVLPNWLLQIWQASDTVKRSADVVDAFLEEQISIRRQERSDTGSTIHEKVDMLNILMDAEEKGSITNDDVKGQLLTFIFAGHDTTAHTLSWMLWEISQHPELQHDLYMEVKGALPSLQDFPIDQNIIDTQLPLLNQVWLETNRKQPTAATGTLRQVPFGDSSIVVGDGLELAPGTSVLIPPYSIHRNEKYWPNPEVFDPSRFTKENMSNRDPMAFQAFSSGPRSCAGTRIATVEALTIMAPLLRRYQVDYVGGINSDVPADICTLTRRPKDGIHFTFTPRKE